jgi:hypothetical protein
LSSSAEPEENVVVNAEGWNDAEAWVYGEEGPEPDVLDAGDMMPAPPEGGDVGDIVGGNIARRKSEDCGASQISTQKRKGQRRGNAPAN